MKKVLLIISVLSLQKILSPEVIAPYETDIWPIPETEIDRFVLAQLNRKGIEPTNPCSDEVFIRRVYLDVIGTKPEPEEVKKFLDDKNTDKRKILIDQLLNSDIFADYWSLKWCDILRVKAEFPINLWPNAVQAYHNWIRDAIKENIPYDRFARELLTSSGSNFRVPPVNFYRAVQGRDPLSIASAVALTFMGTRLENWDEKKKKNMAVFFSRIAYKKTDEWKEEIVYLNPAYSEEIIAVLPDGKRVKIPQDTDPRIVFTDWLIKDDNPYFAKNIVNRIWSWLIGRGIIDPPDDIRQDNPPSNPELLEYLEKELIKNHYDLKHIYRLILNSRTYQQSFIPKSSHPDAERYFAYYPVRRLEAEVLLDIFCKIGGAGEEYVSPIPEPFTFIPRYQRNILLADGSITNSFLELFGRPSRDTGLESERNNKITYGQQMYLLNSSELWRKIRSSAVLRRIPVLSKNNPEETIRNIYLLLLSRYPVDQEIEKGKAYFQKQGISFKDAVDDIVWAIINSKEFLYRH
ncbi:MAG: DUF1549 and DUF1553 domain-containing protein [Candidatus Omnitrophica bacterium]|nr:DUF1549 and DUF1553 domain-containing protein [Candidatus Omnitrophota bacterium]